MQTLVTIPAFGCDGGMYDEACRVLSGLVNCKAVVSTQDSFAAMAEEVLNAAPPEFIIMGTSMGGRLALETTLAAPQRVKGLVVIGSGAGAIADPKAGLRRSARLRAGEMEAVLREMGDMVSHLPGPNGVATQRYFVEAGRAMGPEAMARQSDALALRGDLWPRLGEIQCPVLCLWGRHDKFSPVTDGQRIAASVGHGRYVEIDDCGHFPTLEYSDLAASVIEHWLRDSGLT